jgi:hypothetical protein
MSATAHVDLKGLLANGRMERVARKFRMGEEPSEVEEWSRFSPNDRLMAIIELRARHLRWKYGIEPGLERILAVVRRA